MDHAQVRLHIMEEKQNKEMEKELFKTRWEMVSCSTKAEAAIAISMISLGISIAALIMTTF